MDIAPHWLIVQDVSPPSNLKPPPHQAPSREPFGAPVSILRGADATPARVLHAIGEASVIVINASAIIQDGVALLALSPDRNGTYKLTAAEVQRLPLPRAPIVILTAFRGTDVRNSLRTPWSLPMAFIEAGARAVFVVDGVISDSSASQFFGKVIELIHAGVSPTLALHKVRTAWIKEKGADWVKNVTVSE